MCVPWLWLFELRLSKESVSAPLVQGKTDCKACKGGIVPEAVNRVRESGKTKRGGVRETSPIYYLFTIN